MTIEDDIIFFIAGKIACSKCPLETIEFIETTLAQLKKMYKWREEDLKGIKK